MKQTVDFNTFYDAFQALNPDNFSYDGLHMLFDYLEQYEQDTGKEIELDVIALCCDYNEASWQEVADDYSIDVTDMDEDEKQQAVLDYLNDNTMVCGFNDNIVVYACF